MGAAAVIVVVSWNTRELLACSLESLAADARLGVARVRVVDNGSSDGSPAMVRERFGWAELVELPGNPGYGAAVNAGAAGAREPWIVAANADVEAGPGALGALLAAAERHPRAGVLA